MIVLVGRRSRKYKLEGRWAGHGTLLPDKNDIDTTRKCDIPRGTPRGMPGGVGSIIHRLLDFNIKHVISCLDV